MAHERNMSHCLCLYSHWQIKRSEKTLREAKIKSIRFMLIPEHSWDHTYLSWTALHIFQILKISIGLEFLALFLPIIFIMITMNRPC